MRSLVVVATLLFALFAFSASVEGATTLASVTTRDFLSPDGPGPDGRIDALEIVWTQDIQEASLKIDQWSVGSYQIIGYDMPNGRTVMLRLLEQDMDSDATPGIDFGTNVVLDINGEATSGTAVTEDGAAPILVVAQATPGSAELSLRFSEPVESFAETDLAYVDNAAGGATDFVAASLVHTPGTADFSLTLDAEVALSDVQNPFDGIQVTTNIVDGAGNTAVATTTNLHEAGPVELRANVGSTDVTLVFNAPVTGGTAASDFDVVDAPAIAGVAAHLGSSTYQIHLQLTDPVSADAVRSLEPALLQIIGDRVTVGGETLASTSVAFVDRTAPYLLAAETDDRNRNGFIDAMILTWSEPVDPHCGTGLDVDQEYTEAVNDVTLPFLEGDGRTVVVPLNELSSRDPDTGVVPSFSSGICDNGKEPFTDRADPPIVAVHVGHGAVTETDGANPIITVGTTVDSDGDGRLDAYALQFSEAMAFNEFLASEWTVEGHEVTDAQPDTDEKLLLLFSQADRSDSGTLPDVSYAGNTMFDPAGNPLLAFEGGGFDRVDGANPVIVDAYGDAGSKTLWLEFSEGVEGVTDPDNPTSPGRGIVEGDFAYVNGNQDGAIGIFNVQHGKGDRVAKLTVDQPLLDSDFGTGGDQIMVLQGHIRESNEKEAAARGPVPSSLINFEERDVLNPGTPTEPSWEQDVNSLTLRITAPADDEGDAESGSITRYHVAVHTLSTESTVEELLAKPSWPDVALSRLDPLAADQTVPVAPGDVQQLTLPGLCPSTPYHVSVIALDEDDNPSGILRAPEISTLRDPTPPTASLEMTSITHLLQSVTDDEGNTMEIAQPTHLRTGTILWSGVSDAESCTLTSHWRIDDQAASQVTQADTATDLPGVEFTIPADTQLPASLWFHVAVASDGGITPTFHYPLEIVPPADCANPTILADTMTVRDGKYTDITWPAVAITTLPEDVLVVGYQVWLQMAPGEGWELRHDFEFTEEALAYFEANARYMFIDDADIDEESAYLVNAVLSGDVCRFATDEFGLLATTTDAEGNIVSPFDDFSANKVTIIAPPPMVPTWAWVSLTALTLILLAGVALFYGLRRSRLDDGWIEDEDEENHDDPFGSDPIDDLSGDTPDEPLSDGLGSEAPMGDAPSMDISCPACAHQFTAAGHRPLSVTCPSCNATGVLE